MCDVHDRFANNFADAFIGTLPLLPFYRHFTQRYDSLMSSAPAVDFDCSSIYHSRLLLNVVAHAAAQHAGQPAHSLAPAFSTLTPSSASAASVKSINLSNNWLTPTISIELQQLLHCFPALVHVKISGNPKLGAAGVTSLVSSLAGA